jgi:UDP-glucose 4-epimerase
MHLVVTGGAGFIGTNLLSQLKARYPNTFIVSYDREEPIFRVAGVEYLKGDVTNIDAVREVMWGAKNVFHLAGELGTNESFDCIRAHIDSNIIGTINILDCAREFGFGIVFASKPNVWLNPYSATKQCAEQFARMYRVEFGLKIIIMRFFNVYGPFEVSDKYRKAVPFFINQALRKLPMEVYGDGEQEADFVYVDDAVNAAISALDIGSFGKTIEYGSGIGTRISDLARLIVKLTNSQSQINYVGMRRGEESGSKIVSDHFELRKCGIDAPAITLEDGLKRTIEFYQKFTVRNAA